jgi:hypothetical protein
LAAAFEHLDAGHEVVVAGLVHAARVPRPLEISRSRAITRA